jgi:hypothetical protein
LGIYQHKGGGESRKKLTYMHFLITYWQLIDKGENPSLLFHN